MSDLIGSQASVTFAGISTPANGHIIAPTFVSAVENVTRFLDVHVRKLLSLVDGQTVVECEIDSGTTPALAYVQAGTAAVLTVQLSATPKSYATTSAVVSRMEVVAKSTDGNPTQRVRYTLEHTSAGAQGTQPTVVT